MMKSFLALAAVSMVIPAVPFWLTLQHMQKHGVTRIKRVVHMTVDIAKDAGMHSVWAAIPVCGGAMMAVITASAMTAPLV